MITLIKILLFLLALFGGKIAVELLLNSSRIVLESEFYNDNSARLSTIIGYLERALVFVLLLEGYAGALGWLFAAKSIARFRELENRYFTEYYLIGTFASILWALLCFLLAKYLISML